MMEIALPVVLSFFLGPGMGQLYNKEYKKAGYLLALSLIVFIGAANWLYKAMMPYLPIDLLTVDPIALRSMIENAVTHVLRERGSTLTVYELLLTALWIYGVVDAYRGAVRRRRILRGGSIR